MNTMQTLRKNTRLVLFIALAGFALLIFFEWGLDITGIQRTEARDIARINQIPVSVEQYRQFVRNKERERSGLTQDDIWNQMIEEIMFNDLINRQRIVATDEEIIAIIRSNPPAEILHLDFLKDESGNFDYNKYLQLLQSPQNRSWLLEYENRLRRELPREKLRSLISSFGWVSPFEDSVLIAAMTSKYDIAYLSIPIFRARPLINISDESLRKYYEKHIKDLTQPERKVLKYAFFERRPSPADTLEALELLEDFIARVNEGEDFLELAREISDDTMIVFQFEDELTLKPYLLAAYKHLKNGEVSEIIMATRGFEVIKRIEKGRFYKVKVNIDVSMETLGNIYDRILSFKEAAEEVGFDSAAAELDMPVRVTYPMSKDDMTFPVRDKDGLRDLVVKGKIDQIAGPFGSLGGYYVLAVDSIVPARKPSYEEIKSMINTRIERDELRTAIKRYLGDVHSLLIGGRKMGDIALDDTLLIFRERRDVTLHQLQSELGLEVSGLLATLEPGQISGPLVIDWAGYIIRCEGKTVLPFDSSVVYMMQMKRQGRLSEISAKIFTPEKVIDNRDEFFGY